MDSTATSRDQSPALSPSLSSASLSDSISSINTPDTQVSVLFDADVTEDPLEIVSDGLQYILVVGGCGYIGSHTTLELLKEGYNVIVVDDLSNAYRSVLDRVKFLATEFWKEKGQPMPVLRFFKMDYQDATMRTVLANFSSFNQETSTYTSHIAGVIHFAAFKSVEESIRNPLPYYTNNVCGLVNFLTRLQEFNIKNFVFSSSATVYGSMANSGVPLKEEHCIHFEETHVDSDGAEKTVLPGVLGLTSPYGRTKFMCEQILADVAKSDPSWKITALRYFNPVGCHESGLLGEDPRQKPTNLIPVIATVLTGEKPMLDVFGTDWETPDGTAVRDFIHVQDLSQGHIAALAAAASGKVKEPFRTYNLGTGTGHTVREVHQALENASGRKIPFRESPRRPGDVGFCVANVERATGELGWKAQKSLDACSVDVWNFTKPRCPPQTI